MRCVKCTEYRTWIKEKFETEILIFLMTSSCDVVRRELPAFSDVPEQYSVYKTQT